VQADERLALVIDAIKDANESLEASEGVNLLFYMEEETHNKQIIEKLIFDPEALF